MKVRHRSPIWRRVARRLGRALFRLAEGNEDPRFAHNGEQWLLHEVMVAHGSDRVSAPLVVIDAGANTGGYTREVLHAAHRANRAVEVHAFEPSPRCVEVLRKEFAGADVRLVPAALGDHVGEAVLNNGAHGSSLASLVVRPDFRGEPADAVRVPVTRLDEYLEQSGIARVDLLKLDVEGFELAALHGAGERLSPVGIDVIQFEYGGTTMDAGASLRDLFGLLKERGYALAKLYPDALEVRDYAPWMENYQYGNYVALSPRWLQASDAWR